MTSVVFRRCALPPGSTGANGPRVFSTDCNRPCPARRPVELPAVCCTGPGASLLVFLFLFLLALTHARRLDNISLRGVSPCGAASRREPHDSAVVARATTPGNARMRGDGAVFRRISQVTRSYGYGHMGAPSRMAGCPPVPDKAAPAKGRSGRNQCPVACSRLAVLPVISLSV